MQHFILKQDITGKEIQITDKTVAHQMKTVLRFKEGDEIIVMDGLGMKAKGVIEELHKKGLVISLKDQELCKAPQRRLRLFCALPKKPSTYELIVQKATELGVTDIIPLVTKRCQVKVLRKVERLKLIIKEACEQCERAFVPHLHEVQFLNKLEPPTGELLAGDAWNTDGLLKDMPSLPHQDVNIVIGPEGGLTDEELDAIRKMDGKIFILGENVLRMETAVIAALSVVQFA